MLAYLSKVAWNRDCHNLYETAKKAPMLEKEHEFALAIRWRDEQDATAIDELVRSHLRLVIAVANKFKNYGLPVTDLVQEGSVGLMEAAARFDPDRGFRFSTYAGWWIRSSMQDYVLRNWSIVRTGTTAAQKTLFFNLRWLRAKIASESDGPLNIEQKTEIATTLKVRVKDVEIMEARLTKSDQSLNATLASESSCEWQEMLPSEDAGPDEIVAEGRDHKTRQRILNEAMRALTDREEIIIRERCLTEKTVTLAALGTRLGISKERVRQLESQALGKMRDAITNLVGDPVAAGLAYGV
jgi:RNA polymerase sigma-32 factor